MCIGCDLMRRSISTCGSGKIGGLLGAARFRSSRAGRLVMVRAFAGCTRMVRTRELLRRVSFPIK